MDGETEIGPHTKVINLENYDQRRLLEFLRTIVDASTLYTFSQERFTEVFPDFKKLRMANIERLKVIGNIIDSHHRNCRVAKIVGASAGILGSVAAIGGLAVLAVVTGGLAAPLLAAAPAIATAGGVTATAGGLISVGTIVTEGIINKAELDQVFILLKEDKDYLERVFPFIQRTSELTAAVEELMNFNVFQNMIESFVNNPDVFSAIREERPMQDLPQGMKDFINNLPISANQKQQMEHMLLDVMGSEEGIQLFRCIFDFFRRETPHIRNIYNNLSTEYACSRIGRTLPREAFGLGELSATAVAINALVFVSTFKDENGSRSKLAGDVHQAAVLLQTELNALQKIYDALNLRQIDPSKCH